MLVKNDSVLPAIIDKIYTIRGKQVMLDSDLAEVYGVESKRLNEQVKRNLNRFPDHFMFLLSDEEWENLRSQNATSKKQGGRRYNPHVFTEQGVAMLSAVLSSETAIQVSIVVMDAFVQFRRMKAATGNLLSRVALLEDKQLITDQQVNKIFNALETNQKLPSQGIFFNGQIFDAYKFVSDLIRKAHHSIVLMDNYVDDTTLQLFTKRKKGITVTIFTQKISKQLELDVSKFNAQYGGLSVKKMTTSHDRFLILDNKELYHIGASLKDLGNKIFGFSKMDTQAIELLAKIKEVENG
jgi:ORF6N domain